METSAESSDASLQPWTASPTASFLASKHFYNKWYFPISHKQIWSESHTAVLGKRTIIVIMQPITAIWRVKDRQSGKVRCNFHGNLKYDEAKVPSRNTRRRHATLIWRANGEGDRIRFQFPSTTIITRRLSQLRIHSWSRVVFRETSWDAGLKYKGVKIVQYRAQ